MEPDTLTVIGRNVSLAPAAPALWSEWIRPILEILVTGGLTGALVLLAHRANQLAAGANRIQERMAAIGRSQLILDALPHRWRLMARTQGLAETVYQRAPWTNVQKELDALTAESSTLFPSDVHAHLSMLREYANRALAIYEVPRTGSLGPQEEASVRAIRDQFVALAKQSFDVFVPHLAAPLGDERHQ